MKRSRLWDAIDHVTAKALGNGTRLAPAHALLLVVRGMILAHSFPVARAEVSLAFNQDIKALVVRDDVDSEFLLWWLTAHEKTLLGITTESTHGTKRMPTDELHSVEIALPQLPEQRAIAAALSDVDALLGGLDRLIAKKRDLKQAAIQQLLTGQTRLPGFHGEWDVERVDELGQVLAGKALAAHAPGPLRPYLRTKNVLDGRIDTADVLEMPMTDAEFERFRVVEGDVLLNEGQSLELVGRCSMYRGELGRPCAMQNQLLRFRANAMTSAGFAEHVYRWCQRSRAFASIATQTTSVAHIGTARFGGFRVRRPKDRAEQVAIAEVLTDMDAEMRALEARRDKTRALKEAMMQELLTGNTRLVEPQLSDHQTESASSNAERHNWAINEAVVIAMLVKHFGTDDYPLGRKRYTKLCYLLHRHAEGQAEGYLKKAAGPYNPKTKYGGPEKIALENGYIQKHKGPKGHSGFIAADNITQAEGYFEKWYGPEAIQWLEQFRFKKNDDLEVLATVDMAMEELRASGKDVDVAAVKDVIGSDPDWKAKLDRAAFSDANIADAIEQSDALMCGEIAGDCNA